MMRRYHGSLVLVAICGLAGCGGARGALAASHAAAMRDSVLRALGTYQRLAASAKWDSVAALYATSPGANWIEDGMRTDGETVRKTLRSLGAMRVATTYSGVEVSPLAPGLASLTTYFETRFVGTPVHFTGAISMLWSHEPEGWRIRSGHSSGPGGERRTSQ